MEPAIDVGRSYREWWFLALVALAVLLLAGGALMVLAGAEGGWAVLTAAGGAGFISALAAVSIASGRRRVRITPDGFIVHDRRGEREYTDDQVICASLLVAPNYTNGELRSNTRTFDLWLEGENEAERVRMVSRIPLAQADPLELLIERIIGHLSDRAEAALDARQPFEGEGWALHDKELVVSRERAARVVRMDELAAVDVFDEDLCVWRTGEDEPAARIPMRSANAPVLLRLLRDRLPPAEDEPEIPEGDRLGRALFERRPGRALTAATYLLPVLAALVCIGFLTAAIVRQRLEPAAAGLVLTFILTLVWMVPLSQHVRLTCHEHGVRRRWLWRETRLRYTDVDAFSYSAVRQFVKGVYSGTTFSLTFVSNSGPKPVTLTYSKTLRNADGELDHLRDHVSRVIAARLAEDFSRGHAVRWTEHLRFLRDGLEYRGSGFLGRKPPVVLRYDQIMGVDVGDGVFHLWVAGQKKPAIKEKVSEANFFPGYLFLTRLMASRQAAQHAPLARQA